MFEGTAAGELSAGAPLSGRLEVDCGRRTFLVAVPFSYPDYVAPRERNSDFSGLLACNDDSVSLTGPAKPGCVYGALISANYLEVLGSPADLGLWFSAGRGRKAGRTSRS